MLDQLPFLLKVLNSVSQVTSLKMPNKLHICKKVKQATKKRQRRGLLLFSELRSSFGRQQFGRFPYFPGLLAKVAHTVSQLLIRKV
jgi:hypothetical protein